MSSTLTHCYIIFTDIVPPLVAVGAAALHESWFGPLAHAVMYSAFAWIAVGSALVSFSHVRCSACLHHPLLLSVARGRRSRRSTPFLSFFGASVHHR